jgi:hypothetical protein
MVPGGFEQLFAEFGVPATSSEPPPSTPPPPGALEALLEAARRRDTDLFME